MPGKDEPTPYDVEPEAPEGEPPEGEGSAPDAPAGRADAPEPSAERGDGEGLLAGFDEDADFEHDPQVRAAMHGGTVVLPPEEVEAERPVLVREGAIEPRVWAGIGAVEILAGLVLAAVTAPNAPVARALLAAYNGLLHAGTGVAALLAAAVVLERRFGAVEFAAARMLAAVGAFVLVYALPINLLTTGKLEEIVLGAGAYLGVLAGAFRFGRTTLMVVAGAHFALWLVVQVGMELSRWAANAPGPS